jgi:hypothetical protein
VVENTHEDRTSHWIRGVKGRSNREVTGRALLAELAENRVRQSQESICVLTSAQYSGPEGFGNSYGPEGQSGGSVSPEGQASVIRYRERIRWSGGVGVGQR